jgi:hypothetical protein
LSKNSFVQIFAKKQGLSKRVAKVGFYFAEKKAQADKYLLIIDEALSMFGKFHLSAPFSELYFRQTPNALSYKPGFPTAVMRCFILP